MNREQFDGAPGGALVSRVGPQADPAELERRAAEVQRRVKESRLRLSEFFMNYAQLDRLAGEHELADVMEDLARRAHDESWFQNSRS